MIAPEWVAPDPRDVVFADVAQRARRLKMRRRTPIAATALLAIAAVLAVVDPNPSDRQELNMTGQSDHDSATRRDRSGGDGSDGTSGPPVDDGTNTAGAHGRNSSKGSDGSGIPRQAAGTRAGPAESSPSATVAFTDPEGDADGRFTPYYAGSDGAAPTSSSTTSEPSGDLLRGSLDIRDRMLTSTLDILDIQAPLAEGGRFATAERVTYRIEFEVADSDTRTVALEAVRTLSTNSFIYQAVVVRRATGTDPNPPAPRVIAGLGAWSVATNSVTVEVDVRAVVDALNAIGPPVTLEAGNSLFSVTSSTTTQAAAAPDGTRAPMEWIDFATRQGSYTL